MEQLTMRASPDVEDLPLNLVDVQERFDLWFAPVSAPRGPLDHKVAANVDDALGETHEVVVELVPQAVVFGHAASEAWPVLVAVLHGRAPRTGNSAPEANYHVPWDSSQQCHDRLDAVLAGHVRLAGAAHRVAALTGGGGFAKLTVVIGAVLYEDPLDPFP